MLESDHEPIQVQSHRMTREEFRNDRARAIELASQGHQVIVVDENQQPTMIMVTPRDKRPMRFE